MLKALIRALPAAFSEDNMLVDLGGIVRPRPAFPQMRRDN
jgi:hypothetical protein